MSSEKIRLAPNLTPPVAGGFIIALSLWGFFNPERIPWAASIFLALLGVLLIFQLKQFTLSATEIQIKSLLTGKTKRISKADINSILTGTVSSAASDTKFSKRNKTLTIRTTSKQNITISTSTISQDDFQKLMLFLEKHYPEKLY